MTRLSERFNKKGLSTYPMINRYGLCSIASIITILFTGIIIPEFIDFSFAEEVNTDGLSTIEISLQSGNSADPSKYEVSFMRRRDTTVQFGTLDIIASVSSGDVHEYGYTLTMRSEDRLGRLVHSDSDLRETNYVAPITESFVATVSETDVTTNPFLTTSINHYGYSMDWNGTTGKFYPIPSTESVIRRVKTAVSSDADRTTKVTLGFGVNENLMFGNYTGKLYFTAYSNGAHNVVDHFRLALDPGDGTTPVGMASILERAEIIPTVGTTPTSQVFDLATVFQTLPSLGADHTFRGLSDVPAFYVGGKYYEWDFAKSQYIEQAANSQPDYVYTSSATPAWSTSTITVANTDTTVEAVAYTTYEKKLYLVWEQPSWDAAFMISNASSQREARGTSTTEFDSYFKMQDMTGNICKAVTTGATTTLIDTRDGKKYSVIKSDNTDGGNCWMTSNLAIGSSTAKTWYFNTTAMSSIYSSRYSVNIPASVATSKAWDLSYSSNGSTLFNYSDLVDAKASTKTHYGNFYSFYLANGNQSAGDVSICPKGWVLPTPAQYTTLVSGYSAENIIGSPLNFRLGGKIVRVSDANNASYTEDGRTGDAQTGMFYQGQYGMYWTNTDAPSAADTITSADDNKSGLSANSGRILLINSDGTYNNTNAQLHKGNGASVRCIAGANNNFYLYLDPNGGIIPTRFMTLSNNSDPATATFSLSTNSSYIPYRDSWNDTKMNGAIVEYHRHTYTFLGWHTSPTVTGTFANVGEVQAAMAYPYSNDAFTTSTITVTGDDRYSKVLYAIWAENDILERVDNPTLNDDDPTPSTTDPVVKPITDKDESSKDYAKPYGEDTIDDSIPADVLRVVKLIRKLPEATLVSLEHGAQITEVRDAYEALSSEEKAMIGADLTNKYNAVLTAYYSLLEADSTSSNIFIAALVGAAVSTVAFTTFIIVKKEKENEEEEEE